MNKLLFFLLFTFTSLFAGITLKSTYFYSSPTITLQDLDKNALTNPVVLEINKEKSHYRINAKVFQKSLKKQNIDSALPPKHRYISFIKKSPINTEALKNKIKTFYQSRYKTMIIKDVRIWPHTYLEQLPLDYDFNINPKNIKKSSGNFQLKRPHQHSLLFEYQLTAYVNVPVATRIIKRDESLSKINTKLSPKLFATMKSLPLESSQLPYYCAKHTIKVGDVISQRDVTLTPLIKRHDDVNVQMKRGSLLIEFSAKSLSNGALNDMITLEKADGKRVSAKVVGPLRAEMQ